MTKQHFEAIANAIKSAREDYPDSREAQAALDTAATLLAAELARFNLVFNRARFLTACGMNGKHPNG